MNYANTYLSLRYSPLRYEEPLYNYPGAVYRTREKWHGKGPCILTSKTQISKFYITINSKHNLMPLAGTIYSVTSADTAHILVALLESYTAPYCSFAPSLLLRCSPPRCSLLLALKRLCLFFRFKSVNPKNIVEEHRGSTREQKESKEGAQKVIRAKK